MGSSSRRIEDRAAEWLARRDSGSWGDADRSELADWLRADTANKVAFLRLEAGWERSTKLKAFGAGAQPGTVPPPGEWRTPPYVERPAASVAGTKRVFIPRIAAMAASVVLAVSAGIYLWMSRGAEDYATPVGGVASIALRDGSQMTLNTGSKVRVRLGEQERRIELAAGEAFFDVAKDAKRPFVVQAGAKRIVAVGTRFSVRLTEGGVQVVVTEGKVRFEQEQGAQEAGPFTAGAVARATPHSVLVQKKTVREAEDILSWRSGYLTFDETTLEQAVAEFNRYTSRQIAIDDPALASIRINGRFRATNSDEFILLLRDGFHIDAREEAGAIRLSAN